jgi:predicted Rossmann fold flavoprotein
VPLLLEAPDSPAFHAELSGVAHEVELTVWIEGAAASRLTGALLWTHFGVSGPVALNASRHWARAHLEGKTVAITASFWPGRRFSAVDQLLTDLTRDRAKASMHTALSTLIPASVAAAVLRRLAIDGESILAQLSRDDRRRLAHALVEWPLQVAGTRGYNYAEVTAGGLALTEIDPATMESRVCRGLYLAGEILDVDGRLGGFNFQWAWATAHVAARGLAAAFREE